MSCGQSAAVQPTPTPASSLESLPNEILLQIVIDSADSVLRLQGVCRHLRSIISTHAVFIADRIFARSHYGRAAQRQSLPVDAYRTTTSQKLWSRRHSHFYRRFCHAFGFRQIYSAFNDPTMRQIYPEFPFLDVDRYRELLRQPLALAYIFHTISPIGDAQTSWFVDVVAQTTRPRTGLAPAGKLSVT